MDGYEDEDIDEEDLDDMELEDDEEDILYYDSEEDIDDASPHQSSATQDLPEEYNESEELELEEIDDK